MRPTYFAAALVLVACSDTTTPVVVSDTEIAADVAASSGDVIAANVQYLIGNEGFAGLGGAPGADPSGMPPTVSRSRTCYDAADAVQARCDSLTTAKIVIRLTVDGSRTGERFTGATHRTLDATISGLAGTETSRTHDAVGTSVDSTTFTGERGTRASVESATDSVVAVVFNLPRASNPWPVSGTIIRNVSGTVTVTGGERDGTRSFTRRVQVTFPADAQGNVTIRVNDRTCTLNLVTHRVTNCS